jgi:hypothetical protein
VRGVSGQSQVESRKGREPEKRAKADVASKYIEALSKTHLPSTQKPHPVRIAGRIDTFVLLPSSICKRRMPAVKEALLRGVAVNQVPPTTSTSLHPRPTDIGRLLIWQKRRPSLAVATHKHPRIRPNSTYGQRLGNWLLDTIAVLTSRFYSLTGF